MEAGGGFRSLEIGPGERRTLAGKTLDFAEAHLQKIEAKQVPCFAMKTDRAAGLLEHPIQEGPRDIDTLLAIFEEHVLGDGVQHNHGGYIGFIPGGGIYPSALGDYLAAVTNRQAASVLTCPGAVHMENMMISWVAGLFDFPPGFAGNIASGGSTATVLALLTARHSKRLKGRDYERTVVYVTDAVHMCVQKALNVIGLHEAIVRKVPMDDEFRMIPTELRRMIRDDQKAGLIPSIVVAALGTTNVGSVDPVDEIADVTEEYGLWFHVDAAYGGFYALLEEMKDHFRGVNRADSIIVDPHKSLFLPLGTGIVIVKEGCKLREANTARGKAAYLQEVDNLHNDEDSPRNLSFELSKHFRGARMWLPLQLYGVKLFRDCLREKVTLARDLYSRLAESPGFVVGNYPQLTVVTFHYEIGNEKINKRFNQELLDKILEDGSVFLSSTQIHGKYRLRTCLQHFRCHVDTVDLLMSLLREKVQEIYRVAK